MGKHTMFARRREMEKPVGRRESPLNECGGYSGGAIAAFVIVGIIVVGILVLIILAVALPARMWSSGDDKPAPAPNVVGMPSPAAVVQQVSGMRNVMPSAPKPVEGVLQGTLVRNLPGLPTKNVLPQVRALSPASNGATLMNVMGSLMPEQGGMVTASDGSQSYMLQLSSYRTRSPLASANAIYAGPQSFSPNYMEELYGSLFHSVMTGLDKHQVPMRGVVDVSYAIEPMVAGMARGAQAQHGMYVQHGVNAQHGAPAHHGSAHYAPKSIGETDMNAVVEKIRESMRSKGHAILTGLSAHCPHCLNMFKMLQGTDAIAVDMNALRSAHVTCPRLAKVKEAFMKAPGVPISAMIHRDDSIKTAAGAMSYDKLVEHLTK